MGLPAKLLTLLVAMCAFASLPSFAQVPDLIAPGIDYEYLELAPEPLIEYQSPTNEEIKLDFAVGKNRYFISTENYPADFFEVYNSLTPEQQHGFLKNRAWVLKKIAVTMSTLKITSGIAQWFKNRIQFVKQIFKKTVPEPQVKIDFAKMVQERLSLLDEQIWRKADVVADPNDKFIMVAPGLAVESGRDTRGVGGAYDVGFGVGWNRETKTFIIQIFQHKEKFQQTFITPVIGVGVANFKVGVRLANVTADRPLVRNGTTFYPPGFPGFASETRNSVTVGFSSGLGTLGSDLMGFKNSHKRRVLIGISLSPKTLGIVRLQSEASWAETKTWTFATLGETKDWIGSFFGGRQCGKAYVN